MTRHHTKDNFLVHTSNPLKIIVLLLMINKRVVEKFPLTKQFSGEVNKKLETISATYLHYVINNDKI